jgi:hypothetical protein
MPGPIESLITILTSEATIIIAIIAAAAAAATGIVSYISYIFEKKKALMEVFRLLNDIKHKEARKVVYGDATPASFEILGLENDRNLDRLMEMSETIVRSDLNEVATMIEHNIIDSKIFVEEYRWVILKVWYKIDPKIIKMRQDIGPSDYVKNFERLKTKAEKYAKKHHKVDLEKLKK